MNSLVGSSPPHPPPKRRKYIGSGYRRSNPFITLEASEDSGEDEDAEDEDMEDEGVEDGETERGLIGRSK